MTRENYFSLSRNKGIEVIVLESSARHISRIKVVWALFVEAVLVTALFIASVVISVCISRADNVNAQCESGGNWAASNGGGLQISQASWVANGGVGTSAAASPQQIKVANNIMAKQGRSCSRGEAPVGSPTHVLTFLAARSGGGHQ